MASETVAETEEAMPLIEATRGGYTPFMDHDASVFTGWLKSLASVLEGDPDEEDMRGVHSLMYELALAADALVEHQAKQ